MKKEQLDILTDIFNWVKRLDENTAPQAVVNIREYIQNKYLELMAYEVNDIRFTDFNPYKWISDAKKQDGSTRPFIGTIYYKDGKGYVFGLNYGIATSKLYEPTLDGKAIYENGQELNLTDFRIPNFESVFTKNPRINVNVDTKRVKAAMKEFKAYKKANKDFKGKTLFKISCGAYFQLNHLLKFIEAAEYLGLTDEFYMQVDSNGVIQTLKPLEIGTTDDNKGLLMPCMEPSEDAIEAGNAIIYQ